MEPSGGSGSMVFLFGVCVCVCVRVVFFVFRVESATQNDKAAK